MIEFNKINEEEFNKQNVPTLFKEDNERANNNYAIISVCKLGFQFAWNSSIEPIILEVNSNIYCIGIDQHFAIINFNSNNIIITLNLFYNFYDTKIFKEWIFVITELEIIKIDKTTFKILENYELPDFFEKITFSEGQIEVKCTGNYIIIIK